MLIYAFLIHELASPTYINQYNDNVYVWIVIRNMSWVNFTDNFVTVLKTMRSFIINGLNSLKK